MNLQATHILWYKNMESPQYIFLILEKGNPNTTIHFCLKLKFYL
ncbi:Hypothetical protein PYTT_2175 [Akkermansia glycaniphila]|uniref:Uncharacterized protein n=1 Tax=Akkermansia glycaniphila TaxID=1679444 RepID=A0A1H6MH51_9BACT|nr:Hypothetical protein PYTT_2175 [Akkermansia glycaniphila]